MISKYNLKCKQLYIYNNTLLQQYKVYLVNNNSLYFNGEWNVHIKIYLQILCRDSSVGKESK